MAAGTRRPGPSRVIKLVSLKDDHVVEMVDRGIAKGGRDTDSRAAIRHLLGKRINVDGERLPVFLLAEAPAQLFADDPLDDEVLRDRSGKWATPFPAWLKVREGFVGAKVERRERTRAVLAASDAATVLKNVSSLLKNAPAEAPPTKEPKAPAKAEAPPKEPKA